jgi:hypothetical protein
MIPNKNLMCIGLLALLSLPKTAANGTHVYPLFAGQNNPVGTVTVEPAPSPQELSHISIGYEMVPGWCATHVHIHTDEDEDPIPVNNQGNPKVGNFEINKPQGCSSGNTFIMEAPCGPTLDIAFHANVANVGSDFLRDLPMTDRTVTMQAISYPGTTNQLKDSYWDIQIGGTDYDAWCVDLDRFMSPMSYYEVAMWSSLDTEALPFDDGEYPGNFTKVNWILNQNFVDEESGCGASVYTFLDVQEAIWRLIENEEDILAIGNDCRVTEIYDAAYAYEAIHGKFVPGCGDYVAIVLIPTGQYQRIIAQVIVAQVEITCGYGAETAWAAMGQGGGMDFAGKSWATFITYGRGCRRLLRGV